MKKKKIILILLIAYILIFGINTTYSMYKSSSNSEIDSYYQTAQNKTGLELKAALHNIIKEQTQLQTLLTY